MKSAFRTLQIAFMLSVLITGFGIGHVIGYPSAARGNSNLSQSSLGTDPPEPVFLNQSFDAETPGTIPSNWYVTYPQYGTIIVDGTGIGGVGRCAMIIDNSSVGNPCPYTYFPEQVNTIGVSFALKPTNNSGSNTVIEVFVDDGNFNGANIIFQDGKIGYRQKDGSIFNLRDSYVPDRWYRIRLILNIPDNVYNIHIDDHLEAIDAQFFGACTELHRIVFNETSGYDGLLLPVAYIDDILGRKCIEIPQDYATIQEGIDAANESDIIYVTGQRTYYESIIITKSIELDGEDMSTTVIDGSLNPPRSVSDGVLIRADNVEINGFTVRSTPYGAGIQVQGSNNIIENNNVTNGLGDGINIVGSGNYLADNIIGPNLGYGIRIWGSDSMVAVNYIVSNDACGILLYGSNSTLENNVIQSNLDCGIWIAQGDYNIVKGNVLGQNALGVRCDLGTANNKIYQNRFIGNLQKPQAVDYGANKWDDGYPWLYSLWNETGGGNYWSDFNSFDMYRGANQDQLGQHGSLSPDGICDQPYNLSSQVQDRYPLFIIQNVSQNPDITTFSSCGCLLHFVDYDKPVTVDATMLENVPIAGAFILVDFDSNHRNITMSKDGNDNYVGTIPGMKYGTDVTYDVSVHAELAVEVNSTNYPLPGSGFYHVIDRIPPTMGSSGRSPYIPDDHQNITVWAIVTEPPDASGVANVSLSYLFGNTVWTAVMTKTSDDNYTAVIPRQPGNAILFYNITAVDMAGNTALSQANTFVNTRPVLSVNNTVISAEPCDIDLGVMYRGEKTTDNRLTLSNIGQENLAWNITQNYPPWLISILPRSGVLLPGTSTTIAISVDTTSCLDPNLYVAELSVNANGTIPRWVVVVNFTVRDIAIDNSWCSKLAPQRSNVGETQYFAFHAKWTHNCTDAVSGSIEVNDTTVGKNGWLSVNDTGWANFQKTSLQPASMTFIVVGVDFDYVKDNQHYHIESFTQKAPNLTTIWDRVKVVLKVTHSRIDVGSMADVTWKDSVYEFDSSPFMGSVTLNDTLIKNTVGKYCFNASSIADAKYGLAAFESNSVCCIWDRIKIIGGGTSGQQYYVGSMARVWFIAVYEYDNMLLKAANGTLFVSAYEFNATTKSWQLKTVDEEMDWSTLFDRWEKSYSFDTVGSRRFVVSKVIDNLYGLTVIKDLVGPLDITWIKTGGWTPWPWEKPTAVPSVNNSSTSIEDVNTSSESQPVPVQGDNGTPVWAIAAITLSLLIGMVLTLATILASGKKRTKKGANNQAKSRLPK